MLATVELQECLDGMTAEAPDERQEQWECLHRYLGHRPMEHKVRLTELYRAYEEATGTLIGCD
jgi:hypothetical protein